MTVSTDTITIYKGEDLDLDFTMDPVEDITGWGIELNVKGASGVLITKTGVIVSGAAGTFQFPLVDTDSDSLRIGIYLYDVWRTDAGAERVLAVGDFAVEDVARVVV